MKTTVKSSMILFVIAFLCQAFQNRNANAEDFSYLQNEGREYVVSGKISGAPTGWIYLAHSELLKKDMRIDSTKITGGEFKFSGIIEGIAPFILGLPARNDKGEIIRGSMLYRGSLLLSPGHLRIEGEYGQLSKAHGTTAQNQYNIYTENNRIVNNRLYTVQKKLNGLNENNNEKARLENEIRIIETKQLDFLEKHVTEYRDSEVSAFILSKFATLDGKTLKAFYDRLSIEVQKSNSGKKLFQLISDADATEIGSMAPQFELNDTNGNLIALDSFKGNYVLIDFWASWCGPCREEHPNLIKVHDAYQGKGLKIIGISLDRKKEAWLNAIKEDKLPWLQLGDQKASDSDVAKKYNIKSIPMNFLVDKNGQIIGRNMKGSKLNEKLKALL